VHALPAADGAAPAVTDDAASLLDGVERQLSAAPAPPSTGIWAAARKFFSFRDNLRVKLQKANATMAMPISYGVSYKQMIKWYCVKPENKLAKICMKPPVPPSMGSATKSAAALSNTESKDVYKLFCAEKLHKTTPVCAMSALKAVNATAIMAKFAEAHKAAHAKASKRHLATTG